MKLIINNFPPITQKCEIDLSKKLTLFVGKNNSGKTYISQLIWAIYNFESTQIDYYNDEKLKPFPFLAEENKTIDITESFLNDIASNFSNFLVTKEINKVFTKEINVDIDLKFELEEIKQKSLKVELNVPDDWKLTLEKRKNSLKTHISLTKTSNSILPDSSVLNRYLESEIIKSLLVVNTIYMPSTRLFLPSFYKYIVSIEKEFKDDIFNNFDKLNNQNKSFFQSSYTEPVYALIKKLIFEIDKPIKDNEFLRKLTTLIEGNISIDKSEELGMADISYTHKSGTKLPMHLSSSMVNQLATVYLYFKYWYKKDESFLLLDEPEMNLHPVKKIEFTKILLDFASNNKLLIATHSSTLAKSIINYIHLFDLKEKSENIEQFIEENNLKMDSSIDLTSNDIGIYYFNGQTITSYKADNNSNIHFGTFTEIEALQKKQYDYIMDELEE